MSAQPKRSSGTWIAAAFGIAVVATVIASMATMGTPWQQRRMRIDEARVDDLVAIGGAVKCYFEKHGKLPVDVAAALCVGSDTRVADLVTHRPYEYVPVGKDTYRLCAVFDTDTRNVDGKDLRHGKAFAHPAGRYCFELHARADPIPRSGDRAAG